MFNSASNWTELNLKEILSFDTAYTYTGTMLVAPSATTIGLHDMTNQADMEIDRHTSR